jgi:sugar lactone lactonase YvrE
VEVVPDWELVSDEGKSPQKRPDGSVALYAIGLGSPHRVASGIAVDRQGRVFFSDVSGMRIYKIDLDGKVSDFVEDAGRATGLGFSPDGDLYVCENQTTRIVRYAADGKKGVRAEDIACQDLAVTRTGGVYFTQPWGDRKIGYLPSGGAKPLAWSDDGQLAYQLVEKSNGVRISPNESLVYVSDMIGKWVWSFHIQADGSLANGEPFFRMETRDEPYAIGASGMAVDSAGLLYVATPLGIQVCDQQGRVVAIINRPEQAEPFRGPVSAVAFGGADHQYLYAVIGNEVYRRHLVRKPVQP